MKAPKVRKDSRKSLPGITKKTQSNRMSLGNVKLEKKSKAFLNLNVKDAEKQVEMKVKSNGKLKPVTPKVTSPEVELGLKIDEILAKKRGVKSSSVAEETPTKSKVISPEESNSKKTASLASDIDLNELLTPAKAVLNMENTKKSLFGESKKGIFLQIALFHVKRKSRLNLRVPLKHSIFDDTADACLFTSDVKKVPQETVEYFKDLLDKNGVTSVKEIIPMKTLRREYSQFEEKRKLSNRFEVFLVEGKMCGPFFNMLGKFFVRKRKAPIPVKLDGNILEGLKTAFNKTLISFIGGGNCCTVQIGHCGMTAEQIRDNIYSVCEGIDKLMPSLSSDIKSLMVKGETTSSFPIYTSFDFPLEVDETNVPKINNSPIKGELSTRMDCEVLVYPSGDVLLSSEVKKDEKKKTPKMKKIGKKIKVEKKDSSVQDDQDDNLSDDSDEKITPDLKLHRKEGGTDISKTEKLYLKELAVKKGNLQKSSKMKKNKQNIKVEEKDSSVQDDNLSDDSDEEITPDLKLHRKEGGTDISNTEKLYLKELSAKKGVKRKSPKNKKNAKKIKVEDKNSSVQDDVNLSKDSDEDIPLNKEVKAKVINKQTKNKLQLSVKKLNNKKKLLKANPKFPGPQIKENSISPLKVDKNNKFSPEGDNKKKGVNEAKKQQATPVQNKSVTPGLLKNSAKKQQATPVQNKSMTPGLLKNSAKKQQATPVQNKSTTPGLLKNSAKKQQVTPVQNKSVTPGLLKNSAKKQQLTPVQNKSVTPGLLKNSAKKQQATPVQKKSISPGLLKNSAKKKKGKGDQGNKG